MEQHINVIITILSNSGVIVCVLYIASMWKDRIEANTKNIQITNAKVDEVVGNYLSRFEEIKTIITKNNKEEMEELSGIKTDIAVIQSTCRITEELKHRGER